MNQAISAPVLDLSTCDKEPIRTPGSIQPHGFLLGLSDDLAVLQASANLGDWTGCAVERALGRPLAEVIGNAAADRLVPELAREFGQRPYYVGTVTAENGRHFDVLAHRWDGLLLVEFEAVGRPHPADFRNLYPLIGDFLLNVNDTS